MTPPYQLHAQRRAPRFRLTQTTPTLLQYADSSVTAGELQVISRTGGLLFLPTHLEHGSVIALMFQTHRGLVSGTVEMLPPLSWNSQPFRFVRLETDEENRMQAAFQSGFYRNLDEEQWIEEFRAAAVNWTPPRRRTFFKPILAAAVTLATLCLGSLFYAFSAHVIR
jgi:hypothetical protein